MIRDPLVNSECPVARGRGIKVASVGLKRLFRREIAWNRGVGTQRHRDGGRGWLEESGQRCGGVRKPLALAPAYQGDNL